MGTDRLKTTLALLFGASAMALGSSGCNFNVNVGGGEGQSQQVPTIDTGTPPDDVVLTLAANQTKLANSQTQIAQLQSTLNTFTPSPTETSSNTPTASATPTEINPVVASLQALSLTGTSLAETATVDAGAATPPMVPTGLPTPTAEGTEVSKNGKYDILGPRRPPKYQVVINSVWPGGIDRDPNNQSNFPVEEAQIVTWIYNGTAPNVSKGNEAKLAAARAVSGVDGTIDGGNLQHQVGGESTLTIAGITLDRTSFDSYVAKDNKGRDVRIYKLKTPAHLTFNQVAALDDTPGRAIAVNGSVLDKETLFVVEIDDQAKNTKIDTLVRGACGNYGQIRQLLNQPTAGPIPTLQSTPTEVVTLISPTDTPVTIIVPSLTPTGEVIIPTQTPTEVIPPTNTETIPTETPHVDTVTPIVPSLTPTEVIPPTNTETIPTETPHVDTVTPVRITSTPIPVNTATPIPPTRIPPTATQVIVPTNTHTIPTETPKVDTATPVRRTSTPIPPIAPMGAAVVGLGGAYVDRRRYNRVMSGRRK